MTTMRIVDRVVAGVVALALLAGGIVLVLELALQGLGRSEPWVLPWDAWHREATTTSWSDPSVRVICMALVAAGLALLVLQLVRRKPAAVELQDGDGPVEVDFDRRGLEKWLEARLRRVDGVASTRVRVRRRKLLVHAESVSSDAPVVERRLRQAAEAEVAELRLARRPTLKLDVESRRSS